MIEDILKILEIESKGNQSTNNSNWLRYEPVF